MADIADILMRRATLIGEAVKRVPDRLLWRWVDYSESHGLKVNGYHDGGQRIDFRRKNDEQAALYLTSIRPVADIRGETESEAVPNGEPFTQWAEEGYFRNVKERTPDIQDQIIRGLLPNDYDLLDYTYTAHFSETLSWEESKELGFREAISNTFSVEVGGDVYGGKVSNETTAEFEATQNQSSTKSDAEEQGDEESFSIRIGPGEERRISAKRQVGPMKYVITGWGDLEHGIIIGKHWDGKWQGHRGKRLYPRHAEWASFADFLAVIKGSGPRDLALAQWFRDHPAPKWLIDQLEKPLDQPFRQDVPYDDVGQVELVYL